MKGGVPEAGDIVVIDFDPQSGNEITKRRPGLVLSPHSFNRAVREAWICPITSTPPAISFHLELPEGIDGYEYTTRAGELENVKIEQLRALDYRSRNAVYIGKVPDSFLIYCKSFALRVLA